MIIKSIIRLHNQIFNLIEKCKDELITWTKFTEFYESLDNFEYPHKDKLLEFIKYFFLDHISSKEEVFINFQAFRDHLIEKRPAG